MDKKSFSITTETENLLLKLSKELSTAKKAEQRKAIDSVSPYSKEINKAIYKYNEFLLYYSLRLQEAFVTRPALIKEIDFDMWVSCEGKTNQQLIQEGFAPYAYDTEDGKIEIHHIGQNFEAPFAELTVAEHKMYGNSSVLHEFNTDSWRQDKKKTSDFILERHEYWRKRLEGDYISSPAPEFKELSTPDFVTDEELSFNIKSVLEVLFSECSVDDLKYIGCLAQNYSLMKQIGANSISDYINKQRDADGDKTTCSFCGASDYIAHGTYKTASEIIKRYKCKKCGRTFTQVNNSIISGSNLSLIDWVKFIDCLYNAFPLHKTAKLCGMSIQAAQENRYKLFYALKILDDQVKLKGSVVIDETYVPVSYKGNHTDDNKPPRKSHKRGGENSTPGVSKNKVCVACALDEDGNSVARVAGVGGGSITKLDYAFGDSIDKEFIDVIYGDKSPAIKGYVNKKQIPLKAGKLLVKNKKRAKNVVYNSEAVTISRYIQRINSYHSRLKKFIDSFGGLSSTYLAGYMYLFAWKERNKYRSIEEAYGELLDVMTTRNQHIPIDEILSGGIFPNPLLIESHVNQNWFRNKKKADAIYAMYAKGIPVKKIAKKFNMTFQAVYKYLKRYEELGLSYKTEKEREEERRQALPIPLKIPYNQLERNMAIYNAKIEWQGDINVFYKKIMKKYKLSFQSVKNIISEIQRILALRESIYIHEDISFKNLQTVYSAVFEEYKTLKKGNCGYAEALCLLSEKYNYATHNIERILKIMNAHGDKYFINKKRKLSINETINRDKAVFIDLLRWTGEIDNFYIWASEKYNLSQSYIKRIISFCYLADPKRRELI